MTNSSSIKYNQNPLGAMEMGKHPSRMLVMESPSGDWLLVDWFKYGVPKGFRKITGSIPLPMQYWILPIYKGEE